MHDYAHHLLSSTADVPPSVQEVVDMTSATPAYPEVGAGGFGRKDGTVAFYTRVNALLHPDDIVVDLGAGRGEWLEDRVTYRRELRLLRGKVARVIGADIDPVVATNAACDDHVVMEDPADLPLPTSSVDLVLSDHTLEHVLDPQGWVAEIHRILKPGGWLVGRTPNRWGYIGIATNLVPNNFHRLVLRRAQPRRKEVDIFPTAYLLNSRRAQRKHFPGDQWDNLSFTYNPEPAYFGGSPKLIRAADSVLSRVPNGMGATWHIFIRKRTATSISEPPL